MAANFMDRVTRLVRDYMQSRGHDPTPLEISRKVAEIFEVLEGQRPLVSNPAPTPPPQPNPTLGSPKPAMVEPDPDRQGFPVMRRED